MNEVEEYIETLEGQEKQIASYLRQIILNTSPKISEKLSYGVPYFKINYRLCFIWPATAPYSIIKQGVQFGLCKGSLLSNSQGLLDLGNRKEVAIVNFTDVKQIDEQQISEILFEAIEVDEMVFRERKKKR